MDKIDEPKDGKTTVWTISVPQGMEQRLVLFSIVMNPEWDGVHPQQVCK